MIRTPLAPVKIIPLNGDLMPLDFGRLPGLHLGTVLRAWEQEIAEFGSAKGPIEGEDPDLRRTMGFLWERAITMIFHGVTPTTAVELVWREYCAAAPLVLPNRCATEKLETQLGLKLDGLAMTPDAFDPCGPRGESYKLTWRSMNRWIQEGRPGEKYDFRADFADWFTREKAYLWAMTQREGRLVDTMRFFIFWVNGDYTHKPGHGPQATWTDVTWTEGELEENWRQILTVKAWYEKRQKGEEAARCA